jgi:predicted protein tyrosine phosphatase
MTQRARVLCNIDANQYEPIISLQVVINITDSTTRHERTLLLLLSMDTRRYRVDAGLSSC